MKVIHILRKPVSTSSVAANCVEHGCGALHINAGRIGFTSESDKWAPGSSGGTVYKGYMDGSGQAYKGDEYQPTQNTAKPHDGGRWPANMILAHKPECHGDCEPLCPVLNLDVQSGVTTNTSNYSYKRSGGDFISGIPNQPEKGHWKTETGGASRFFKQVRRG